MTHDTVPGSLTVSKPVVCWTIARPMSCWENEGATQMTKARRCVGPTHTRKDLGSLLKLLAAT